MQAEKCRIQRIAIKQHPYSSSSGCIGSTNKTRMEKRGQEMAEQTKKS